MFILRFRNRGIVMAMGAPEGIRHGKAEHPFALIEYIRDCKEYRGDTLREICKKFPNISRNTLMDWVYYCYFLAL